jgi:hypothetical protein
MTLNDMTDNTQLDAPLFGTIDEIEKSLELKTRCGNDIRTEVELKAASDIKLWMIEDPLNTAIVLATLDQTPFDLKFSRRFETERTVVCSKYQELVRMIDVGTNYKRTKTIRETLIRILRTKDSEY